MVKNLQGLSPVYDYNAAAIEETQECIWFL